MSQPNNPILARTIADALANSWRARARPNQLPPASDWQKWLILAGRGFGKTRSGAEWINERVTSGRARRIGIAAATAADVRDVCVEGESGILNCSPDWCRPRYEPSKRRLTWPNGCTATTFSADRVDALRGPQFDTVWCDELASWRRPQTFDMMMFGLRLNDALGGGPQCCITTTPRPTRLIREIIDEPGTIVTTGTSYENRENLAPAFFNRIIRKYENTRLGRQELLAELLTDQPGALWTLDQIDALRRDTAPPMRRIVVAIDPSGGEAEGHDEVGIVACGVDHQDHGWVLADQSGQYSPDGWARAAIKLYHQLGADRVVAEINFGGQMVESVLRQADPNVAYRGVSASRGKVQRAEPVSALFEQGRCHMLGSFPELEDELTNFTHAGYVGSESPNRADALVWALSDLLTQPMRGEGLFNFYREECEARRTGIRQLPAPAARSPEDRDVEETRQAFWRNLNGRTPTGAEINALEAELLAIHRSRTGTHP
jgi:phage terminase large subunit-like protein